MKEKNIIVQIILTLVTCGVYGFFWLASMGDEIAEICPEEYNTRGWTVVLYTLLTCGIYSLIWTYQAGKMLAKVNANKTDNSVLYIVLSCVGLQLVAWYMVQDELNKLNAQKASC